MEHESKMGGNIHKRISALAAGAGAVALLAACGASRPAAVPAATATSGQVQANLPGHSQTHHGPLTCTTVMGIANTEYVIRAAMIYADPGWGGNDLERGSAGAVAEKATPLKKTMLSFAQTLSGYSGTKLAADAARFASDMQRYAASYTLPGPPPAADVEAVRNDVKTMAADCSMPW
jgi:hypothetical protein